MHKEWLMQEETQRIIKEMESKIVGLSVELGQGNVLSENSGSVGIAYAQEVGVIKGLTEAVRFMREGFENEDSTS